MAIAVFASVVLASCTLGQPDEETFTPEKHEEAGSVNVAVTFIDHWSSYRESLQANFDMPPDEALRRVIPKTTAAEERILDAVTAGLKLAIGAPAEAQPDAKGDDKQAPAVPDSIEVESIDEEPILEYTAAAALYQEVQLLNRYVERAALQYHYWPFIIRIQVGISPYGRSMPFDVYSDLSFHPYLERVPTARRLDLRENEKCFGLNTIDCADCARQSMFRDHLDGYDAFVVPLLVTDVLEGTLSSHARSMRRQLSIALALLQSRFGAGADYGSVTERFQSGKGTRLNSLRTVSESSDNTLSVRLGASSQPTGVNKYTSVPRTHTVTLLVLVPVEVVLSMMHGITEFEWSQATQSGDKELTFYEKRMLAIEGMLNRFDDLVEQRNQVEALRTASEIEDLGNDDATPLRDDSIEPPEIRRQHVDVAAGLYVKAKSVFKSVKDGSDLPTRSRDEEHKTVEYMLTPYLEHAKTTWPGSQDENKDEHKKQFISGLFASVALNNYGAFSDMLRCLEKDTDKLKHRDLSKSRHEIWLHMVEIAKGDEFSADIVQLPMPIVPLLPDSTQLVILKDDGKILSAQLRGGEKLATPPMSARLHASISPQGSEVLKGAEEATKAEAEAEAAQTFVLDAISASVDSKGENPSFEFPSLRRVADVLHDVTKHKAEEASPPIIEGSLATDGKIVVEMLELSYASDIFDRQSFEAALVPSRFVASIFTAPGELQEERPHEKPFFRGQGGV